jgi:hypothetical protein
MTSVLSLVFSLLGLAFPAQRGRMHYHGFWDQLEYESHVDRRIRKVRMGRRLFGDNLPENVLELTIHRVREIREENSAMANPVMKIEDLKWPNAAGDPGRDLSSHELGCYSSQFYETPQFNHAYATGQVWPPARGSICTYSHPARSQFANFFPGAKPDSSTLITPM